MTGIITVPLHIGDFLSGTMHMDTLEKGAYVMLLLAHYQSGKSGLPNDDTKLSRIAGVSPSVWKRIKPIILEKFEEAGEKIISCRVQKVISGVEEKSLAQRAKVLKRYDSPPTAVEPQYYQPKPKPNIPSKEDGIGIASDEAPPAPVLKLVSKRGTRLTPDWELPVEWGEWALTEGLTRQQVLSEEEAFRDYWISVPGGKGIKLEWQATWRNWVRKSKEFKRV